MDSGHEITELEGVIKIMWELEASKTGVGKGNGVGKKSV